MPLVALRDVHKTYRLGQAEVPALKGIDLTLARGEFAAIWGPSGSGKSSLLNLIGLIDTPSAGDIQLNDQATAALSDRALARIRNRHIGFVFQNFNLVPVLSAEENVMLPLTLRGEPRRLARERARARLNEVGLAAQAAQRPDTLSGGQRQRVAIARALVTEPDLVIADEPTANLDADNSQAIVELMRRLNRERQITFLFSTHDPRLIDRVDRLIRLVDGQIQGAAQ